MTVLITGGSKCGKSSLAEKLLETCTKNKYYIATMKPYGGEALEAIERHRRLRAGKGFETLEKYTGLYELRLPEGCFVLLECMANLCANEMFTQSGFTDPTDNIMRGIGYLKSRAERLVIVTNSVGSDGVSYSPGTNAYIKALGELNALTAEISDTVIECVYGIPVILKGRLDI